MLPRERKFSSEKKRAAKDFCGRLGTLVKGLKTTNHKLS